MYKCPICGSTHLTTHVIMKAEVEIDANTGKIRDNNEILTNIGLIEGPDNRNTFTCKECGFHDFGSAFKTTNTVTVPKAALGMLVYEDCADPDLVKKARCRLEMELGF